MTTPRVTGPRNTTHMRGVGCFNVPQGEELKTAASRGAEANRRNAEKRRNPEEPIVMDWRSLA